MISSNVVKLGYATCNRKLNIRLGRICIVFQKCDLGNSPQRYLMNKFDDKYLTNIKKKIVHFQGL